jgi:uncharacterized membrane protein
MNLTPDQQAQLMAAIRQAELETSGEIRVHLEEQCPGADPVARAVAVFRHLGMHQTKERNGVLFYVAYGDRKFAVVGDAGIDAKVPTGFWDSTKDLMRQHFAANDLVLGLSEGIERAGQQLKQYFPRATDDVNELPDDISFG